MNKVKPKLHVDCKEIEAKGSLFRLDPAGYVLIRINYETNQLEIGFCRKDNIVEVLVKGKNPRKIYQSFVKNIPTLYPEHYSYIGYELGRAYYSYKYNKPYVQDDDD
ncbi:MAG: hypothetical protein ACMXYG_05010 [Candidatus Woesearchaeota archaeon]